MKSALQKKRATEADAKDRGPRPMEHPWQEAADQTELSAADLRQLAHDTRNWLTALQVYCDLLRMTIVGDCERWVMELTGAIDRGQRLVASLLESSRATGVMVEWPAEKSGRARRTPPISQGNRSVGVSEDASALSSETQVDLTVAISRRLPLLQRLAGTGIHVDLDAQRGAGIAMISESDFDRILLNLVLNAIEAMPHGGRLQIVLRRRTHHMRRQPAQDAGQKKHGSRGPAARNRTSQPDSETLLLRICDSGTGIAADRLPHIFDSGVSTKAEPGAELGIHGYGLFNVRTLVERAGGKIRARSRLGRGSCFEVELPRATAGPALSRNPR